MINFFPPIQERDKKGKKDHIVSFRIPSVFLKSLEYISKANNRSINLQARSFLEECIENFAKRENLVFVSLRIFFSSQLFKSESKIKDLFMPPGNEEIAKIVKDVLSKKDITCDLFFVFSPDLDETSNTPIHLKPPMNLAKILFSFFPEFRPEIKNNSRSERKSERKRLLLPGLYDFMVNFDLSFPLLILPNLINLKVFYEFKNFSVFSDLPLSMFLIDSKKENLEATIWLDSFLSNLSKIDNESVTFL